MVDGITKGVGEQLGGIGKKIATDVAKLPGQIAGLANEDSGVEQTSASQTAQGQQQKPQPQQPDPKLAEIKHKDELEKQQKMAQARQLLQQFIKSDSEPELTVAQKQELEELEEKKKEIAEEKEKAKKILPHVATKRPKGDLFGIKAKQFAGEVGKNVKAQ